MNIKPAVMILGLATLIFIGGCGKKPPDMPDGTSVNSSATLGQESDVDWRELKYSFTREQYVHPGLVEQLLGWLDEPRSEIVEVDVTLEDGIRRFYGKVEKLQDEGETWILSQRDNGLATGYRWIGVSSSGIHVLHCIIPTGGSGEYGLVLLAKFKKERQVWPTDPVYKRERVLLRSLLKIPLGVNYDGKITFQNNVLTISPSKKSLALNKEIKIPLK